jgi:predicted TIM-barrel fold metal-dependent hydrolase
VSTAPETERLTIISSDCHAGGNHAQYREYLAAEFVDEFDAWRGKYANPFRDLQDDGRSRNWDNERRVNDQNSEGVVAEVLFPNTVPPFFPTGVVIAPAPKPEEVRLRQAGIEAHNRWLADFVADYPERRVGLAQIFLNDVDQAIVDVRWAHEHGIKGVLLPGVSPDTQWIEPLFSPNYDPLWAVCEELGMPVTHHSGGSGIPEYPDYPVTAVMFLLETSFFANRALWHLIMSGVFERFPALKFVLTEQGTAWIPGVLKNMDGIYMQMTMGRVGELGIGEDAVLPNKPSHYFDRNVWVGASFPAPSDTRRFHDIGIDKVMWGSDYPHNEATSPWSIESIRKSFAAWDGDDLRRVLAGNAADVYGFDLDVLAPIAAEFGPTLDEIAVPLEANPEGAMSPAFWR